MLRRRGGAGVAPRGPSGSRARLPHVVPRQTPPDGPRGRPHAQTRGLRADWRASGKDLAAGRPCGGPRKLCRAGRALCPAKPLPRPARGPSPSRRPPRRSDLEATRFSWLSHKTETGCAAPSGFCTGRDLCRPWGPQLSAVARGPLAAPRGVFPGPAVGGAAAQDAQALGKPARPPPAARRRGEQAQSGFLTLGRCPLLAGCEAFFFLVTCLALHCVRLGD